MDAKEVVTKIMSDANAEVEKIRAEAKEKIQQQQAKLKSELGRFDEETESLAAAAAEDKKARVLAAARMDISKQNLQMRKDLLDEVFAKAAEAIKNMNDADYIKFMEKLLIAAVETSDEKIVTGKNDGRLGADFLNNINKQLGGKGSLSIAEEKADIQGGFILRSGKTRINASLEVLLSTVREELETELAKELFN